MAASEEEAFEALRRGGAIVLMRHAIAPGGGDPPGFVLEDCATQRNLSADGREQARRTGAMLRSRGVAIAAVLSSRWCRALETARLLDVAPVEGSPPFDSFFANAEREPAHLRDMRAALAGLGGMAAVVVTHQVNITALTGVFPASGELVVIAAPASAAAPIRVFGRIKPR
ncbi:hypothetical protein GCM10007036_25540 [Alsobacter metallidurans]|uniref:Histidine phosphatase family protein n=2 Tax=Alsobacter metallidurans TaxID=340221 RepID=A0A917MIL9_9HYPH|nr:hypothetical protein GCM10007036_25540 [Alsobacter metallidurans]